MKKKNKRTGPGSSSRPSAPQASGGAGVLRGSGTVNNFPAIIVPVSRSQEHHSHKGRGCRHMHACMPYTAACVYHCQRCPARPWLQAVLVSNPVCSMHVLQSMSCRACPAACISDRQHVALHLVLLKWHLQVQCAGCWCRAGAAWCLSMVLLPTRASMGSTEWGPTGNARLDCIE